MWKLVLSRPHPRPRFCPPFSLQAPFRKIAQFFLTRFCLTLRVCHLAVSYHTNVLDASIFWPRSYFLQGNTILWLSSGSTLRCVRWQHVCFLSFVHERTFALDFVHKIDLVDGAQSEFALSSCRSLKCVLGDPLFSNFISPFDRFLWVTRSNSRVIAFSNLQDSVVKVKVQMKEEIGPRIDVRCFINTFTVVVTPTEITTVRHIIASFARSNDYVVVHSQARANARDVKLRAVCSCVYPFSVSSV